MRNGTVLLDGYVPDEDAMVVERVLHAGAPSWARRSPRAVLLRGGHTAGRSTGAQLP
jgi:hypothetical protein